MRTVTTRAATIRTVAFSLSVKRTASLDACLARSFFLLGLPPALIGSLLMLRWLVLYLAGTDRAHVPSLIAAAVLLIMAFLLWLMALIGELLAINRRLLQDIQYELRKSRIAPQAKDRP